MNGKIVPLLAASLGVVFGALITTLVFSFSFYGTLRDADTRSKSNQALMVQTLSLVQSAVESMSRHVEGSGHAATIKDIEDHEDRIRGLEKAR